MQAGVINGIGHYFGYRNFNCPDRATNIVPWGILIGGEELHNNHHTYGSSAKLSVKKWEFDIGWGYIKILEFLGLAKVKKVPSKTYFSNNKTVDEGTMKAILLHRFQVMASYTKEVIRPLFHLEKEHIFKKEPVALGILKKVVNRNLLIEGEEKHLSSALRSLSQNMQTVFRFHSRLQEIWSSTTASKKEIIDSNSKLVPSGRRDSY